MPSGECRSRRLIFPALLSFLAIGIVLWGFFQLDLPSARFVRSIHLDWLERLGDLGTRLGSGAVLVAFSVLMLAAGGVTKRRALQALGMQTLLAHGAAALLTQLLKHGIGRPRPRLLHADNGFPWAPSLEAGLDSFPSGHTTASFAVAAVIARRYPELSWPAYLMAGFVALSRVVRGSHFPTDVVAGVCLGTVIGWTVAEPLRDWRRSIGRALVGLAPPLVLVFGAVWLAASFPAEKAVIRLMLVVGVGTAAVGLGIRIQARLAGSACGYPAHRVLFSNLLIILGLAVASGSWLVVALTGILSVAKWLERGVSVSLDGAKSATDDDRAARYRALLHELPLTVGLVLALLAIYGLKGALPILSLP
ncbi:phosphatase PAP2 family protein [Candidatus Nitrospira bockiana]